MQQTSFFKLSLTLSFIGIFFLLLLANASEPKLSQIKNISNQTISEKVKISGTILSIKDKSSFKILTIEDKTGKIDVLCNCKSNIKLNQTITVKGKVSQYQNSTQISADEILS